MRPGPTPTSTTGALWCWGFNYYGQVGDGTTTERHTPEPVGDATTWKTVDVGGTQACATRTTGALRCWGENTYGQLGDGTTTDRHTPTPVSS